MKEMEKDHEHNIKRVKAIYEAFFVNANGASEVYACNPVQQDTELTLPRRA